MNKILKKFVFIVAFFIGVNSLHAKNLLELINAYPSIIELTRNPQIFFESFQYELDNYNPIFGKKHLSPEWREITDRKIDDIYKDNWSKRFSLSVNLTSTVFSIINYSIKATALREAVYVPEIYLGFGHFFYIPPVYGSLLGNKYNTLLKSIKLQSFSTFIGFAKSFKINFKFYGGYRFSYGKFDMSFKNSFFSDDLTILIKNEIIDSQWLLHDFFLGLTFLLPDSNLENLISLGFNPEILRFNAKVEFLYKYVGIGLVLFPDNILTFRPFVRVLVDF